MAGLAGGGQMMYAPISAAVHVIEELNHNVQMTTKIFQLLYLQHSINILSVILQIGIIW